MSTIFDDGITNAHLSHADGARSDLESALDSISRALRYAASLAHPVASQIADDPSEGAELAQSFHFLLGAIEGAGRSTASAQARLESMRREQLRAAVRVDAPSVSGATCGQPRATRSLRAGRVA